ncbi:hypothetical protein BSKO_06000 [Bryopsis sp. KO-2023]|nr:hypothetical protein BSKO_06000 [Bryopsis sp. KO-2023]
MCAAASALPRSKSPALEFEVVAAQGWARTSKMKLPHYVCETPMFMPVGTHGTVKGLTSQQLQDLDCHLILGNTYHLESRPGADVVEHLGGLHGFADWPRAMLTDSGGFQMVSLLHLAEITEEGVEFQSPVDGAKMLLTPEHSISIQNKLGADIIMALDDVVPATTVSAERFEEATHRTTRWIDRCIAAHSRPNEQNLFAIIQGGVDPRLRDISLEQLTARDMPGFAIGGLVGGESKDYFWRVVKQCTAALPKDKPIYVMGVGYPLDIVVCSALGADMYDSVYPTRTARFGVGLTHDGTVRLKNAATAKDTRPVDPECDCMTCRNYTRAALHGMFSKGNTASSRLLSYHNVAYMMRLAREMRESIKEQRFPQFVRMFMKRQHPHGDIPQWIRDAMASVDISLEY